MTKINRAIPVKVGEKIKLTVENLVSSGDGISRYRGYTLFVPDCVTGDQVFAEVVKVTPRFGVCKAFKMISPSRERIEPFCPYFYECGGCQLQFLPYDKQACFKINVVKDTLYRIGKLKLSKDPVFVPASHLTHYRNRGTFPISGKGGKIKIGFYARGSHDIVDIHDCPVMFHPINRIKEAVRCIIEKYNPSIYSEANHRGFIRNLIIRGAEKEKSFLIGFVTTAGRMNMNMVEEIADINKKTNGEYKITGIVQNINSNKTNVILGKENKVLWGEEYLSYTIGKVCYQLSLTSFSQINPYQTEKLNNIVEEMLSDEKGLVLDAYCGIGNIALWLASHGKKVIGVEEHENAVKNAVLCAKENKISNCSFVSSTVEDYLACKKKKDIRTVILNPPRKGCSNEVIEAILKTAPVKIIYVSCNPATLARDSYKLCSNGYVIKDLRVIDMFPQTVHMETVMHFSKL